MTLYGISIKKKEDSGKGKGVNELVTENIFTGKTFGLLLKRPFFD